MFKVFLSQTAIKELKKMTKKEESRIKKHLKELEKEPYRSRPKADIKRISGQSNPKFFRLRIGNLRVIYTVIKKKIMVTEIMKRGKGYSWMN